MRTGVAAVNLTIFQRAAPAADLPALWQEFKRNRSRSSRAALVEHYAPLVKQILRRLVVSLPGTVDFDDLIGCGVLGLIQAIENYDPGRGIRFEAYAQIRIRGAILDELRRNDWLPRTTRLQVKGFERALADLEQRLGRTATDEEIMKALDMDRPTLERMLQNLHIELLSLEDIMLELFAPDRDDPTAPLEWMELQRALAQTIENLPERERLLITLYYYEEFTLTEIGRMLSLSQPRISQLHARAIRLIRGSLADFLAPARPT